MKSDLPRSSPLLTAGQLQRQGNGSSSHMDDLTELESPQYPGSLLTLPSTFSITDGSRSPLASSPIESSISTLTSQSSLPAAAQQSSSGSSGLTFNSSSPWPGIWKLVTVVCYFALLDSFLIFLCCFRWNPLIRTNRSPSFLRPQTHAFVAHSPFA